jgi:hypothetical protein
MIIHNLSKMIYTHGYGNLIQKTKTFLNLWFGTINSLQNAFDE